MHNLEFLIQIYLTGSQRLIYTYKTSELFVNITLQAQNLFVPNLSPSDCVDFTL